VSAVYLYALVDAPPEAPLGRGLANEPLYTLRAGGLTAVIGVVEEPPSVTPEALRAHDRVVRAVADRVEAIAPCRFGTACADEGALVERLEEGIPGVRAALEKVRGCSQMTLRVFAPGGGVDELRTPHDEGDDADGALGPGARYLTRRMRDAQRARELPVLGPLRTALAPLIRAERIERHTTPPLVASVYHLVSRGDADAYLREVREHADLLHDVRVTASGPWPPYAFAAAEGP
jgi:hypothetical protein